MMDDLLEKREKKAIEITLKIGEDGRPQVKKIEGLEVEVEAPEKDSEAENEKAGLAPDLKNDDDKKAMLNGEEDEVEGRMKDGIKPRNLDERVQRKLMKS